MSRARTIPLLIALIAIALSTGSAAAQAQQTRPVEKNRLGIATPYAADSVMAQAKRDGSAIELEQLLDIFEGQLVDRFNATRKFTVVARKDLPQILKEQELAQSGNIDGDDEQAAEAFKLAGARYLVVLEVDSFQDVRRRLRLEARGTELEKRILQVGAVTKLYDTTTGALLESYNDLIEIENIEGQQLREQGSGTLLNRSIRDAAGVYAQRAANRIADVIFPAKVIAARNGIVTINRGDGTGVRPGDIWTVYAVDPEPLVDPDTGEVLGAAEFPLGDVRITRVEPKFAQAMIIGDDLGVDVGMIARPNYEAMALRDEAYREGGPGPRDRDDRDAPLPPRVR